MKQKRRARWLDPALCLGIAAITFLVAAYFSLYGCDPHHDGVMFEAALKVARGGVLFRDTFTQYGALAVWYDALFIRLLGESMASIQIGAAAALAGCACLLYTITKKLTAPAVAVVTALLATGLNYVYFWHSHPWSSLLSLLFQLLACELLLQWLATDLWPLLAAAGACGALGAWCRLPVGLLTFVAGGCALVLLQLLQRQSARRFWSGLAVYAVGFAATLGLLFLPLVLQNTLDAWWGMVVVGTSSFAAETNTAGASTGFVVRLLWSLGGAWILRNPLFDWIWLLLPACMGLTLLWLCWPGLRAYAKSWHRPRLQPLPLVQSQAVVVCVLAFGGWAQYYPVSCYRHWYWSALPMLPILAYDLWLLLGNAKNRSRAACLALAVVCSANLALRGYFALASVGVLAYAQDPQETRPGLTSFYMDEHWNRAETARYTNADYPYLNGLRLAPEVAEHYDSLFAVLTELEQQYPEKNVINRTSDGFLGVFQKEYVPYGSAPYSEYGQVELDYIAQSKPVVLTESPTDWAGYSTDYQIYAALEGNDGRRTDAVLYVMVAE